MNHLIEWLVVQAKKKHNIATRSVATLCGLILFVGGIPALVFLIGRFFDKDPIFPIYFAKVTALVCFIIGLPWMISSVFWQLIYGGGTPVPAVPTKKFLQNGPYRYVRNPMMLVFFLYLLGWTFLFNHYGAFLAAGFFILLLLGELKFIEEHELERRFGNVYQEYKKETPFLFPRGRRRCIN